MRKVISTLLLCFIAAPILAQYTVNGFASQVSCNEYRLTQAVNNQNGSVWNNNRINLTQSFDFSFDVFLGNNDSPGADGIAFVLQPISTNVGSSGGGLGYQGITPAVGVTLDTYANGVDNDPAFDHIALQLNGDLSHNTVNNLAGPVQLKAGINNFEDGQWHILRVTWDAAAQRYTIYIDGELRLTTVKDFITDVFAGNPLVFWGFTGSTGGENNYQGFRIALKPDFRFLPSQTFCVNQPITFVDSTISFAPVVKFYWDFGDGSPLDSVNKNPVHIYTTGNVYTVSLRVIGADGCIAVNQQTITIGTKPDAKFGYAPNCISLPVGFIDSSSVTVGTLNQWYWDFGDNTNSTTQNPSKTYTSFGNKNISLAVKSLQGCQSDTAKKTIYIYTPPIADFAFTDSVCVNQAANILATVTNVPGDTAALAWSWVFDVGNVFPNVSNPSYNYALPGNKTITLRVAPQYANGYCTTTVTKNIFIVDKPTAYFTNNTICQSRQTLFTDSSYSSDNISVNQWWWNINGSVTGTQNTISTVYNYTGADTVKLVVRNSKGCASDTLKKIISINPKPVAKFGVSNPVCEGAAVLFTDSSTATNSTITQWAWIHNNINFSSQQNSSKSFTAGNQTVGLIATSAGGCTSDTAFNTFFVNPIPNVSINFRDACKFAPVTFSATDNSGVVTQWKWEFGDGATANTQNAQHIYNANGVYKVKLTASVGNSCFAAVKERDITIYGTNAFAGNDTIAAAGQPLQLRATGGLSYTWSPANLLDDANSATPVTTLQSTQTFTLRASTPEGCESFDVVTVKIYKGPDIYLPNAFTPNGDGLNDVFRGIPVGIKQFDYLRVFNRWGQLIFNTADYRKGWDGNWKGQQQPAGVYVVLVAGTDYNGKAIAKKATVMLIR